MVKIEVASKVTIKPSSQTPHSLQNFNLSLIDQITTPEYIPIVLYYEANHNGGNGKTTTEYLKQSLSQTLVQFYPLSGRIKENLFIECNDEGVDFWEANIDCPLSQILKQPEADVLDQLLPSDYHCRKLFKGVQVAVQVNHFSCHGMAIGVCVYHKIVDGSTMTSFLNSWASIASGHGELIESPKFIGPSLFPPRDLSGLLPSMEVLRGNCITKRFVFDGLKVSLLRSKIASSTGGLEPTRVQAVAALIWKCEMEAFRENLGSLSPSSATMTVNLRPRMAPPLPECCAGNILWLAIAPPPKPENQLELHILVDQIRNAVEKFDYSYIEKMQGDDGFKMICESLKHAVEVLSTDTNTCRFTSWCRFPLYDADFGWGRPAWISSAGLVFKNMTILIDTKFGNGIEAWITLDQQDMAIFECNTELLEYVSSTADA